MADLAKPSDEGDWRFCKFCNLTFGSQHGFSMHLRGIGHMQKASRMNSDNAQSSASKPVAKIVDKPKPAPPFLAPDLSTSQVAATQSKPPAPTGGTAPGLSDKTTSGPASEAALGTAEDEESRLYCSACNIRFTKESAYWAHMRGLAHYHRVEELEKQKDPENYNKRFNEKPIEEPRRKRHNYYEEEEVPQNRSNSYLCEVCDVHMNSLETFNTHLNGMKHAKLWEGYMGYALVRILANRRVNRLKQEEAKKTAKPPHPAITPTRITTGGHASSIQAELDKQVEPLVGLDYITEFQKADHSVRPRFVCDLCESKMDGYQVVHHVIGFKHRLRYFKYHAPHLYDKFGPHSKKSEKTVMGKKYALILESTEGRHTVKLRVMQDPFSRGPQWREINTGRSRSRRELPGLKTNGEAYIDEPRDPSIVPPPEIAAPPQPAPPTYPAHTPLPPPRPAPGPPLAQPQVIDYGHSVPVVKPAVAPVSQSQSATHTDESMVTPASPAKARKAPPPKPKEVSAADKVRFAAAAKQAKQILTSLGDCKVNNEKDAEMALQISNALTQALLAYRMRGIYGAEAYAEVQGKLESLKSQAQDIQVSRDDQQGPHNDSAQPRGEAGSVISGGGAERRDLDTISVHSNTADDSRSMRSDHHDDRASVVSAPGGRAGSVASAPVVRPRSVTPLGKAGSVVSAPGGGPPRSLTPVGELGCEVGGENRSVVSNPAAVTSRATPSPSSFSYSQPIPSLAQPRPNPTPPLVTEDRGAPSVSAPQPTIAQYQQTASQALANLNIPSDTLASLAGAVKQFQPAPYVDQTPQRDADTQGNQAPLSSGYHQEGSYYSQQDSTSQSNTGYERIHETPTQANSVGGSGFDPVALTRSRVFAEAKGLIDSLSDLDFSKLSSVATEQLNEVLAAVSGINEDLARSLPREMVEAAGAFAIDAESLSNLGGFSNMAAGDHQGDNAGRDHSRGGDQGVIPPDLANLSDALAKHFPAGLLENAFFATPP